MVGAQARVLDHELEGLALDLLVGRTAGGVALGPGPAIAPGGPGAGQALHVEEDVVHLDPDRVGQDPRVLPPPDRILQRHHDPQPRLDRPGSLLDVREVPAQENPADHVFDQGCRTAQQPLEDLSRPVTHRQDEVRRVLSLREHQDPDVDRVALVELEGAFGRPGPCLVRVECQDGPVGEPREEAEVLLAERGAAGGDGAGDPGLVEGDDVGVALHQERSLRPDDVRLRPVHVVEQAALVIQARVGRVHVLRRVGRRPGALQQAPAEPHRVAGKVVDGEHDPAAEAIPEVAAAVLRHQARLDQDLRRIGLGQPLQEKVGVRGRVAHGEALHALLGNPPLLEVGAGLGSLPGLEQRSVVQPGGVRHGLVKDLAPASGAALGPRLALVPEDDAGLGGELLHRLGERQVLNLLQEPEHPPALAAPEAVVGLLARADR